jgi:hypothetical protein
MSRRKLRGLLASGACVVALAVVIDGCSSSSSTTNDGGGGQDAAAQDGSSHPPPRHVDASPDVGTSGDDGSVGATAFDGTTGNPCTTDLDCKGTDGGAPVNVCSNGFTFNVGGVSVQLWPTPVCIIPLPGGGVGNCDPGNGATVQGCDGGAGICLPNANPPTPGPGNGVCFPACVFNLDGSAPVGCPGKDTCIPFTFQLSRTTGAVRAVGFCQGSCETDADCSALGTGWGCQQDIGFCTRAKKTRTKTLGTPCTNSGTTSDSTTGSCNCFTGSGVGAAYCTSSCVTGGAPCPNGWVCDAQEPARLDFTFADGGMQSVPGPTMQNVRLSGLCMPPCALTDGGVVEAGAPDGSASDAATDAAAVDAAAPASCPVLSTCAALTVAGPDCQPM